MKSYLLLIFTLSLLASCGKDKEPDQLHIAHDETSDVVSLHTPLTQETMGMINQDYLSKFTKPFYILNTARGQSLVLSDLVESLKSGKVLGACLDVLEYEKTSFEEMFKTDKNEAFDYLSKVENVILSPHVAGWTNQSNEKIARILGEKIINFFSWFLRFQI